MASKLEKGNKQMKVEVNSYEQFKELFGKGEVLVDFYATWCGPCKMIAPIVEQISNEIPELTVLSVDVDEIPQAAMEHRVSAIPTLLYVVNGQVQGTQLGFVPKPKLLQFIGR